MNAVTSEAEGADIAISFRSRGTLTRCVRSFFIRTGVCFPFC